MLARHCNLTLGQALQSSQSLPTVPLLDTDVDVVLLGPNLFSVFERVSLVCEGVYKAQTRHVSVMHLESMGNGVRPKDGAYTDRK